MLIPYILHPTRIHGQSRTITDNIFFNQYNKETISGNLTPTISDHLTQFLFVPSMFSDPPSFKQNMYERNWFKLNKEDFTLDYFMKAWDSILYLSENDFDFDFSFNNFLMNMNELLETHPRKHLLAFKTSWRRLQEMSWRRVQNVFSVTIFRHPRRLANTSWGRSEDILEDERRLQDVLETNKMFSGISLSSKSKSVSDNLYLYLTYLYLTNQGEPKLH